MAARIAIKKRTVPTRSSGSRTGAKKPSHRSFSLSRGKGSSSKTKTKSPTRATKVVDMRRVTRRDGTRAVRPARKKASGRVPGAAVQRTRVASRKKQGARQPTKTKKRRFARTRNAFRSSRLKRFVVTVGVLSALGGATYGLLFSSFFRVERVVLRGNPNITKAELNAAIRPITERKFLGVPLNGIFLVSSGELEDALHGAYPQLSDVSVTKKYPSVVAFDVAERNLAAIWQTGDRIVFLDARGVVCCDADVDALLEQDVPRVVDQSVRDIEVGQEATLPRHLNYVGQLTELFDRQLPMQIARFELPSARGEEVHVVTAEGVRLMFSLNTPAESQVSKFKSVLREEIKDSYPSLQYVDLRVEDYVYYK